MHKSADRLKTQTPTFYCVQASPFIPRQTRSPFTPIESRPFLRDPRFFRFVESSYTQYLTHRERERESSTNHVTREAFTWPSPYSRSGEIPKKRTHLLEVRVACWRCTWAGHRIERERKRETPPPLPPLAQCYTLARGYTGIGRDPDVSEVRPHPALCPAHVTIVRVVIRVNVWPMNPSTA